MKIPLSLVLCCLCLCPAFLNAAQIAQARLYCISVKLSQGQDEYGDKLNVTSTGNIDAGLGDLPPYQNPGSELMLPGGETYSSNISLYDTGTFDYLGGSITISIDPTDFNENRFPDFFEVSTSTSVIRGFGSMSVYTYGTIPNVVTSWSRSAGSRFGSCVINADDGYFGTFRHQYEVMEYKGTLTFTPATNKVTGTLNLTQSGNAANTFQASLEFLKSAADKYNELTLQPGTSTGALLSTMRTFTNHVFTRDATWRTNYAGFVEFSDGDPWTFEPYAFWVLSITDTSDSDRDGIPDFSDDPTVAPPPRAANLSLTSGAASLQLSISGDVGRQYEIQESASLSAPNWQTTQTVTLSTDPQSVSLPFPASTKYWRAVAH